MPQCSRRLKTKSEKYKKSSYEEANDISFGGGFFSNADHVSLVGVWFA